MNPAQWLRDLRYRAFYTLVTQPRGHLVTLGDECQWTICDANLNPSSNVLCGGAGNDISFEKELIHSYGCRVVLVDPSPTGMATAGRENLPGGSLTFLPVGLAAADGLMPFQPPADDVEGSFTSATTTAPSYSLQLPCKTLSSLMRELGWSHIDLLKIDIEGFEFAVLRETVEKRLDVRQICVEFHHGKHFSHGRGKTAGMILSLRRAGYDLVHRVNWDHTFVRRDQAR